MVERKLIGGTCVNTGCIPTKTLVASAHATHLARDGAEQGVGTVPTCGSPVFGVFNGGDATDIVYDEDTRLPLPTSVSHPSPQACTRCWPSAIAA